MSFEDADISALVDSDGLAGILEDTFLIGPLLFSTFVRLISVTVVRSTIVSSYLCEEILTYLLDLMSLFFLLLEASHHISGLYCPI